MTPGGLLLSTAYFPPVHYMALASRAEEVFIEREENYIKQSYRNRCHILSANGRLSLSVPVLLGSFHKTSIRDIRIDYSKRWQKIHLGAVTSSYRSSPYYEYYFEKIRAVILRGDNYLLDLNMHSLDVVMSITGGGPKVEFTSEFVPAGKRSDDFRFTISPKERYEVTQFRFNPYQQVFSDRSDFIPGLSIIDLIFNTGPDARNHLSETRIRI
jgi:hypothetical protein